MLSLLPSATEIVYALGLDDRLVGVTDECDYPPPARDKPVVSRTVLPTDRPLGGGEIDGLVRDLVESGQPIYRLDTERIRRLQPDLILAQDLCRVCAVPSGDVAEALDTIGCRATVVSLDPGTLDDVIGCIEQVGAAAGVAPLADGLARRLRDRVDAVTAATAGRPRPRTLVLEWRDPFFTGGHWIPDMIDRAGGDPLLGSVGVPSRVVTGDEIAATDPEVVVLAPCGWDLPRAMQEAEGLADERALRGSAAVRNGRVFAADAMAYFSRPSPRIVDGLEALAWAIHPDAVAAPPAGRISRVR